MHFGKLSVSGSALFLAAALFGSLVWAQRQPIDFPHDKHAAKGLECIDCHSRVDTRAEAGLPSVNKCMLCHEKIETDGPGVTVLREYAAKKREVPWERVYGFNKSAHVKFRHAPHVKAGLECSQCHGDVSRMTAAEPAVKHTMGTCLDCHRKNNATQECMACHF